MQNEGRELIAFPSKAEELLAMTAAERDHWLGQEMRRARALAVRHGITAVRNWVARNLGLGRPVSSGNVVSVRKRATARRDSEARRDVA